MNAARAAVAAVRIWWIDLDAPEPEVARCTSVLDSAERARSRRFHFARDARRFTVARATLRSILGEVLGIPACDVGFTLGPFGKPELDRTRHDAEVTFNVSHSEGVGVIAVTEARRIGVDVERVRTIAEMEGVAKRVFSRRELDVLSALPPERQPAAFFAAWTRKEAFIKAVGTGLSHPLDAFSVTFGDAERARIVEIGGDAAAAAAWSLHALDAPAGFTAALACEGEARVLPASMPAH